MATRRRRRNRIPDWQLVLKLIADGGWVKLSGANTGFRRRPIRRYHPVRPLADRSRTAPLPWGSDWPHVGSLGDPAPNVGDLLDVLAESAPDPATRRRHPRRQPARLCGFPDATGDQDAERARTNGCARHHARRHQQGFVLPRSRPSPTGPDRDASPITPDGLTGRAPDRRPPADPARSPPRSPSSPDQTATTPTSTTHSPKSKSTGPRSVTAATAATSLPGWARSPSMKA